MIKNFLTTKMRKEYNACHHSGGKTMLNRIDRFNHVVFMQFAVPAYYWQNNGLTLPYPYSSN